MKVLRLTLAFAITFGLWTAFTQEAGAIEIDVSINGQVKHCASSPCTLSNSDVPSGAGFTLNSGEVTASDANPDHITLKNLVITAGSDNASGTIIFWATFTGPPDATPANPVGYYHSAKGNLRNSTGTQASLNSWVKLTGYVQDDVIVATWPKTVTCTPLTCGDFYINPAQKETWFDLTGSRSQKGKLEFMLKTAGHKLNMMDGANPHKVTSGPPAGGPDKDTIKDEMRMRSGAGAKSEPQSDCETHVDPEGTCTGDWLNRK